MLSMQCVESDELAALCDCLCRSGILRRETYLAALHRRRFEALRYRHPCASHLGLADVFNTGELCAHALSFLGLSEACRLRTLARCIREASSSGVFAHPDSRTLFCSGRQSRCGSMQDSVQRFDPTTHRWSSLPTPTTFSMGSRCFCMPALVGLDSCLYVCGTQRDETRAMSIHCFSTRLGQWTALPAMATQRCGFNNWPAICVLGAYLYVCGGSSDDDDYLNSAERFDPSARRWESLPPMGTQRACAAAAALQGQLYVCGGETGTSGLNDFVALDTAERFNPRAGHWENLPRMSEPRGSDANGEPSVVACALGDCLYVRGGHEIDSMERFDVRLGCWQALPPMWTPRYYAVMIACNNRLYVCGGRDDKDSEELNSIECFDPKSQRWEVLPSMHSRRANAGAAASAGYVYVCGGKIYEDGSPAKTVRCVERYCVARNCWEVLPEMTDQDSNLHAVILV